MRRAPLAALIGIAALVSLGVAACTGRSGAVGVGTASRGDVTEIVDASATVTAKAVATLTAPAAGTIASLAVAPGTQVQAGQVVAVIDSPPAQQQLAEATTVLAGAENTGGGGGFSTGNDLAVAQRKTDDAAAKAFDAARQAANSVGDPAVRQALLAQIDAAAQQYASLSATARSLVGSVQRGIGSLSAAMSALGAAQRAQAQSAYDLAKSTVDSLTLRAPIAGVVQLGGQHASSAGGSLGDLLSAAGAGGAAGAAAAGAAGGTNGASGPGVDDAAAVGSQVGAGSPIATIVDVSSLGLIAQVDETDILLVSPGVSADVELDAAPGATYQATAQSIDMLPTTSTSGGVAYRVRLTLGPGRYSDGTAAPTPRPGMSAVAHLSVHQAYNAVTAPAAAVFSVDGHDAVWLVRDGHAVQTRVTVGVQGQDRVQILSGVGAGDELVVRGTDQVKAGQSVP